MLCFSIPLCVRWNLRRGKSYAFFGARLLSRAFLLKNQQEERTMDGTTVNVFKMLGTLITPLRYGGIILAAFCWLTKRRDKLAVVGLGLAAVSWIIPMLLDVGYGLGILISLPRATA